MSTYFLYLPVFNKNNFISILHCAESVSSNYNRFTFTI